MNGIRTGTFRSRKGQAKAAANAAAVRACLGEHADAERARTHQKFFQTHAGGYGEGDVFIGLRVPVMRRVAKQFRGLPLKEVRRLLRSKVHEERLVALMIMGKQFKRGSAADRERIFRMYLAHTRHVNNWDLVDLSAAEIVGAHLHENGGTELLDRLARSPELWERRIAMVATHHFIRAGEYEPTLRIAEMLLEDRHDLIHKAAGWMLREVEKRDGVIVRAFLKRHLDRMPRTMLRYAIERFPERERQAYLKGRVQ